MEEIWKDIKWYEWLYQVSSLWRVKSLDYLRTWMERILKWWVHRKFYKMYIIRKDNKSIPVRSHRLVAIHFIPNPLNLPCACHKLEILDDDWCLYNWVDNLWWWTHSDNMKDMQRKWRANNHLQNNNPRKWKFWKDNPSSKKINQYSLEWEFIKEWDSMADIQRELPIFSSNISYCCKWKYKSCWWFIWKYN